MEKYILNNQNSTIIINRNGNEVFLSISAEPIHTDNNTFRYDGSYTDTDTNKKYFVNVKISTMDSKKKNRIEVLGIKNIKTDSRIVKESNSKDIIKFIGTNNGIRVEIKLPMKALTHKYVDIGYSPKRVGYVSTHNKHGNCGVSQIFSGGLVNPR